MKAPRTAFVLAGGGSLGALQVGMLAEILKAGEPPDFSDSAPHTILARCKRLLGNAA
jgi:hypothetical protein